MVAIIRPRERGFPESRQTEDSAEVSLCRHRGPTEEGWWLLMCQCCGKHGCFSKAIKKLLCWNCHVQKREGATAIQKSCVLDSSSEHLAVVLILYVFLTVKLWGEGNLENAVILKNEKNNLWFYNYCHCYSSFERVVDESLGSGTVWLAPHPSIYRGSLSEFLVGLWIFIFPREWEEQWNCLWRLNITLH